MAATWSGLGISAGQPYGSWYEVTAETADAIFAPFLPQITKFPRIRMIVDGSSETSKVASRLWAAAVKAYSPSTYIHFGIADSSEGSFYAPNAYAAHLVNVLDNAEWAEANGMDAFQVANEWETSGNRGTLSITGISRASNVATATTSAAHNLVSGDTIIITGASDSSYNVSQVACTVTGASTFTYASTGSDGSASGTLLLKCGDATIIRIIKMLATEVQAVFSGEVTYSVSQGYETYWTSITPGTDLDTIGLDIYGQNGARDSFADFKSLLDAMFAVFNTQMYISEFNIHASWSSSLASGMGPTNIGFDIAYADEVMKRLNYIRTLGLEKAYFFSAWNASASENNAFTAWYNTNRTTGNGGALQGNWKSIYNRLLGGRAAHVFKGTQQTT